jgi:hypothetical protein
MKLIVKQHIQRQQVASQAIQSGAFGGGREGVQLAESERARLSTIGSSTTTSIRSSVRFISNWIRTTNASSY